MATTSAASSPAAARADAFTACERLAKSHYENFSVATWLLPARLRRHIYPVYAFCRGVDDLGDEFSGDRSAALDEWERQTRLCYSGTPTHPYFIALQETVEKFDIPHVLFLKLIEANRRDQRIKRYPHYAELLDYCDHSANPVGRMVLYLFGHREEELHILSDYTCTALQLTNFWQDVWRDYESGRIYLPLADMRDFGVDEQAIADRRATPGFKRLMKFEVERTRDLFRKGYPLSVRVVRQARIDVTLFTAGGLSVLKAIEAQDHDVLASRPALSKRAKARLLAMAWLRTTLGLEPLPRSLIG